MNSSSKKSGWSRLSCLIPSFVLCLSAGCSGTGPATPDSAPEQVDMQQGPPLGMAIQAPPNTWTWVDFPDSTCDEGTPTGLAVNPSAGPNLLLFLNGGGACWDYTTCVLLNTSAHGPFQKQQFDQVVEGAAGSILDRNQATPFRDWNLVFITNCTGDVHAGDNDATYSGLDGSTKLVHHKGRANLVAFLSRLAATFPHPAKLVVSGSSAGGFGTALDYDLVRKYFPVAQSYLLDDSGPLLIGDAIPSVLRDAWFKSWGLDKTLSPLCPGCTGDLSSLLPILSVRYPKDRKALLSYTRDGTIRGFFLLSASDFQKDLYALATSLLDPAADVRYFFQAGTSHTMLVDPAHHTSQGVALLDWLNKMISDDPGWKSIKP